ncbi:MAG: VWA domain-containing protein [Bryobacteraceae bacterium]|nr:VWA domain-containing protein [Bryobacteraceae bacterium]
MGASLFFIVAVAAQAHGLEQEPAPVFRAGAANVRVDALVLNGNAAVNGLAREDFLLTDEKEPREILSFSTDREPLSLTLLLDISGSMQKYLREVSEVAHRALKALRPGDRVSIVVFGRTTQVFAQFSEDLDFIASAIGPARNVQTTGSATLINPSILEAASLTALQPGRRAVLILTDNQGLHYQSPDEDVIRRLSSADILLYAIVVGGSRRPKPNGDGKKPVNPDFTYPNVFRIAEESGGEAIASSRADAFATVLERIRDRYTLIYQAPPAGEAARFREIRVELAPAARKRFPKARVLARRGYWLGE